MTTETSDELRALVREVLADLLPSGAAARARPVTPVPPAQPPGGDPLSTPTGEVDHGLRVRAAARRQDHRASRPQRVIVRVGDVRADS